MADGEDWSDAELHAALDTYFEMLRHEQNGLRYNKAAYRRALLSKLNDRSETSVEFRMRNISAVLDELCEPWIKGYRPATNVGPRVKARLRALLEQRGDPVPALAEPTGSQRQVDERTAQLRRRLGSAITRGHPRGNDHPSSVTTTTVQYVRDPLVKAWVLETAQGRCEVCRQPAPFVSDDGLPFLEVHHVTPLAAGGSDTIGNAVAVCPNCHRLLHYGSERKAVAARIRAQVPRLALGDLNQLP